MTTDYKKLYEEERQKRIKAEDKLNKVRDLIFELIQDKLYDKFETINN